jgi:CHASE2 domain-containing sensor protein
MRLALVLFGFFALLVAFLGWKRVPRHELLSILSISASLYAIFFFLTLWGVAKIASDFADGLVPYIPPMIVVVAFVAWSLRRVRAFK